MYYHDFKGEKISALGMGTMRLPVIDGDEAKPDFDATREMVAYALEHGVNYFDTAWGYHSGHSEEAVGAALEGFDRDSFYLTSKFPGYDVANFGKHVEIFAKQLEKCRVDHFDFYLIHNVCEVNIEQYLDDGKYGTVSYFKEQRDAGKIAHLGFSVHGRFDTFERFMDAYGDDMEFCQIQLNYEDWEFQDAKAKVAYCAERGLPVIVMEPLRGGILCNLPEQHHERLATLRPGMSDTEWAFRWLEGVDGIVTVLSGMSDMDQLRDNIAIFGEKKALTGEERTVLEEIGHDLAYAKGLPCTACRYCVDHCPQGLDIPHLIYLYNEQLSRDSGRFIAPMSYRVLRDEAKPDACIACGACHAVCPQQLAIPEFLAEFAAAMHKKKDDE